MHSLLRLINNKNRYLHFAFWLLLVSCSNEQERSDKSSVTEDSLKVEAQPRNYEANQASREAENGTNIISSEPSDSIQLIMGVWAQDEDSNAAFEIERDSIYYWETDERIAYQLSSDSFVFDYGDGNIIKHSLIKLSGDSLVYKTATNFLIKLYKRQ